MGLLLVGGIFLAMIFAAIAWSFVERLGRKGRVDSISRAYQPSYHSATKGFFLPQIAKPYHVSTCSRLLTAIGRINLIIPGHIE
jgi:hypothetical protein